MSKTIFQGKFFKITHTIEAEGPHPTLQDDYYDDTFSITALLQGSGDCYVEGNHYPMADGDMMLLGLDEIRCFRFAQTGYHERISLYFTSALLSPLWEHELPLIQMFRSHAPGMGNRYTPSDYDSEKVQQIFTEICRLIQETPDPASSKLTEARIHLLLLQLLFVLYDAFQKMELPAGHSGKDTIIRDICRYIHENLTESLTYQHLQKRFPVSRYQMTEIFQQNTGMTLTEYIILKRLIKVSALVRDGAGIEAAAFQAGFRTYSHFYKEFMKYNHISPRKYYFPKEM